MRRALPLLVLLALAGAAFGQSNEATSAPAPQTRPAKAAPAKRAPAKPAAKPPKDEGLFARARVWASRTAYAYGKGGRQYAERLVRRMPKQFAAVRGEVTGLSKRVAKSETLRDLDQKRAYLAELWRLRASLDLMALLEPRTLETITGIDARLFQTLRSSLDGVARTLGVSPAPKPGAKPNPRG